MSILEQLTSLFAPDDCVICGREGHLLCRRCQSSLPAPPNTCFGCKKGVQGVACSGCLQVTGLGSVSAATHYSGASKRLVASLKFYGNQSAARYMAQSMQQLLPSDALLIHMPATTAHVRQRGYDQSALLTMHLHQLTGLPRRDLLRRSGQSHQLGADRHQRLHQLSGSLSVVNSKAVRNNHIILVDDVLTTGASLTAAARILRQSGAARVDAVVFAQAIDKS